MPNSTGHPNLRGREVEIIQMPPSIKAEDLIAKKIKNETDNVETKTLKDLIAAIKKIKVGKIGTVISWLGKEKYNVEFISEEKTIRAILRKKEFSLK